MVSNLAGEITNYTPFIFIDTVYSKNYTHCDYVVNRRGVGLRVTKTTLLQIIITVIKIELRIFD